MSSSVNENASVYYVGKYWNDYPECLSIINTRLFRKDIDWLFIGIIEDDEEVLKNCGDRVDHERMAGSKYQTGSSCSRYGRPQRASRVPTGLTPKRLPALVLLQRLTR